MMSVEDNNAVPVNVDVETGEVKDAREYVLVFPERMPPVFGAVGNVLLLLVCRMRFNTPCVYLNAAFMRMCENAGVSRSSLHRALSVLHDAGIIVKGRGVVYLNADMFAKGRSEKLNQKKNKTNLKENDYGKSKKVEGD